MFGNLILFGSGETSPTGKKIHRSLLRFLGQKQTIAILETPAGFQPNSALVAREIADAFRFSLSEFIQDISIIPARKKGIRESPDNKILLKPLTNATYIFLGPGSPTYLATQLANTKALNLLINRWKHGATICLSSAAAIGAGSYTLPVYEIYKVGADLYWEKGLNLLSEVGFSFTVVTHWNNREGGKNLDTRYCFMGKDRFLKLQLLLPEETSILGIDEQTAVIFDFTNKCFWVEGAGSAVFLKREKEVVFTRGKYYAFDSFTSFSPNVVPPPKKLMQETVQSLEIPCGALPKVLQKLLEKRSKAKDMHDFTTADLIRLQFAERGYKIEDGINSQKIYKL